MSMSVPADEDLVHSADAADQFARWQKLLEALATECATPVEDVDGVAAWRPPDNLGPLPPQLREQAESVLAAIATQAATVSAAFDGVNRDLHQLPGRREAVSAYLTHAATPDTADTTIVRSP